MREITKQMIEHYKIMELGYDFMGYPIYQKNKLSFHHTLIPKRHSKDYGIGDGYVWWNGAILYQPTSHEYLHLIESKNYDMFLAITSELFDETMKGYLDKENLLRIRDILVQFEKEHIADIGKSKGNHLIKEEYLYRADLDRPMSRVRKR